MALSDPSTNKLTERIIGAAIEVHRELGPGLLESTYEDCLSWELREGGIGFVRQPRLPVIYKGMKLGACYRPDVIVQSKVIIEIKTVEKLAEIHSAQVLTYLSHTGLRVGLLFNFNSVSLRDGMRRISL